MTPDELQTIEAELQKRGYRKWTTCLTSTESWAWFKTFHKIRDKYGEVVDNYQVAFRVWDYTAPEIDSDGYGVDVYVAIIDGETYADMEAAWRSIADIDTFERMAAGFDKMVREFINPEEEVFIIKLGQRL